MTNKTETPILQEIQQWFEKCFPEKDTRLAELQIGVMLEEVTELLKALGLPHHELEQTSDHLKEARYTDFLEHQLQDKDIRTEVLDAFGDINVTLVGSAYACGFDYLGALKEISRSNNSKFDKDGNPLHDEVTNKVIKSDLYTPPELEQFT